MDKGVIFLPALLNFFPTLYLLSIGKVKDLRVTLAINNEYDDDMIVFKGGETDNLVRKIDEHNSIYGKMPGASLYLKHYNYIDPQYIKKAESELLTVMGKMNFRFDHPKFKELLICSKKDIRIISEQYTNITRKYIGHPQYAGILLLSLAQEQGHLKDITNKLKDLENQIVIMKKDKEIELLKKDKENNLLKKEIEIIRKDIEIYSLKNRS